MEAFEPKVAVSQGCTQSLEAPFAQLAHPLSRNAVANAEYFQRRRWIIHLCRKNDITFARRQSAERCNKHLPQTYDFQVLQRRMCINAFRVGEHVHPIRTILFLDGRIQRKVGARDLFSKGRRPWQIHPQGIRKPAVQRPLIEARIFRRLGVQGRDMCRC